MQGISQDLLLGLGALGTVISAALLWMFAKVLPRGQHDEIVKLIQSANGTLVEELRTRHQEKVQDLRARVDKQAERLDRQEAYNRELQRELLEVTRENGALKTKVALLEKEVEILGSRSHGAA